MTIIGHGKTLAEGTVAEILGDEGLAQVRVVVASPERAAALLQADGLTVQVNLHHLLVSASDPSHITRALAGHGLYVGELTPIRPDLESAFLALTAEASLGTDDELDPHRPGLATQVTAAPRHFIRGSRRRRAAPALVGAPQNVLGKRSAWLRDCCG